MQRLLVVMATLRDPEKGCPWDREQSFSSILPYTLEEAYEVADAIDSGDMVALREELGDLLFQVVFHTQMASEQGEFSFDDVVEGVVKKLEQRHPHVFGGEAVRSVAEQSEAWEGFKAQERATKAASQGEALSVLDNVPTALPGLLRALKLQRRAARSGFDWPDIEPVLEKIKEELREVCQELASGGEHQRLSDEVGDLLFSCVNLARHLEVDPEVAMRGVNSRFEQRFRYMERRLSERGDTLQQTSLDELERLWQQAKEEEHR